MIGGEFVLTGDGMLMLALIPCLLGFWAGWMGGKAEGVEKERERNLVIRRELRSELDYQIKQRKLTEAGVTVARAVAPKG